MQTELNYYDFAKEIISTGLISDPWIEGKERFSLEPIILSKNIYRKLCIASEEIGRAYQELADIIWRNPKYVDEFFGLTPYEKLLWFSSNGEWHGIARMDMFILKDEELMFCEMNSDTPSGEAEAVLLNQLTHSRFIDKIDPNFDFGTKFFDMVYSMYRSTGGTKSNPTIGIVYPTEMPEDLSMIMLYQKWFNEKGCDVILGSPYNIHYLNTGGLSLFDKEIDILFRHYKTDWWCERFPVWTDGVDYPDPDPLEKQIKYILESDSKNKITIVNPFGAVVTQNKFSMAFMWQKMDLFSFESQNTIKKYIPETFRLVDMQKETLSKDDWVLKSDFGCEGDEVVIGPLMTEEIWKESLEKAIPEHWVIQKYFDAVPIREDYVPNYGIYLIAGEAFGIYSRLAPKATDYRAITVPTFIEN